MKNIPVVKGLILALFVFAAIAVKANTLNVNTSNYTTSDNSSSAPHPNMFLDASEIASIKAKIDAGQEPWVEAYNTAISRANTALNQPLISVRDGGSNWDTGVYDGNFSENRHDYRAVGDISHAVRDLGIAYAFSGNEAYADKAIALIYHWCLNPTSLMKPQFNGGQSLIELTITLPAMFYGADMLWNYSGWDTVQKAGFITWVETISAESRANNEVAPTNNFGTWRLMFLASAAVITENSDMMTYVVDFYKVLLPYQIHHTGFFPWEFNRDSPKNGLFYSTFAMVAATQICEIVRHHGVDLYHWEASNGNGSIERGLDYMAPFVADPSTWAQTGGTYTYTGENAAVYELAYAIWQKPAYKKVIERWGRPMYGSYVQGPLTLTHAFRNLTVDVPQLEVESDIIIYPNPTSNIFTINLKNDILKRAIIFNRLGQQVKEVTTREVNISDLPSGIYFVKISSQSGKVAIKKVVKNES